MLKMTTYPGMILGGEVRESISLDEDDLSDVEDEVFIRDGKNSYKMAEELNVKRPLMAPRRKLGKPDLTSRLKARPPCKALCKPCCYIFAALSVLIGLIALVVILASIFPLPLDKLRAWLISRTKPLNVHPPKLLPCSSLKVTDVWATNLPILTTDSPVRLLDLNFDGTDDIIFGFGTGDNYNVLPPDLFCPIFLGVPPPCEGGVIALNGTTGKIIWRFWTNDTIYALQCTEDLNEDGFKDCLAVGIKGTLVALDSRNGSVIWLQCKNKMDIYVANFIPDQNNDSVADILASHTSRRDKEGHLLFISGRTGKELKRIQTPNGSKTYFMPQLLKYNDTHSYLALIGTGSPNTAGNLSVASLDNLLKGNYTAQTIYADAYKGILTQSILVDITGDRIPDIITCMYNSTIVAINGKNFEHIWNYTIPNSETNITPTPGYFNADNITDFLIIYKKYDNILNYNYTETYIIDGKLGKPIDPKPITGSVFTQLSGLTLSMESYGFDMFLFWTTECTTAELLATKNKETKFDPEADVCRQQSNTTNIMKLNALNQYDQPPGFEIYNSVNRTALEFNNTKSPLRQIQEYFLKHPKMVQLNNDDGQLEIDDAHLDQSQPIGIHKYGSSSFRHKDNRQGIVKDYMRDNNNENENNQEESSDYDWQTSQSNMLNTLPGDIDLNNYNMDDQENPNLFNEKQMLYDGNLAKATNRDPRSKEQMIKDTDSDKSDAESQSKKKNLADSKYGLYDYKNIKMSRNRLLHDLDNLPSEILRDTFFKNRESQLRKSRFEQRDINSHIDKMKENAELKNIVEKEKKAAENTSFNLWDMESEKEVQDKENGYWRGKRDLGYFGFNGIRKISSVGAVISVTNGTNSSVDIVFVTYWQPKRLSDQESQEQEVNDCIEEKLSNASEDETRSYQKTTEEEQRSLYRQDCENERESLENDFQYFNQIYQLSLGQLTVYRLRVECVCDVEKAGERCAKFLPQSHQNWPMYLGKLGDGVFIPRN